MTPVANPPADEQGEATGVAAVCSPLAEEKPVETSHAEALKSTSIIGGSKVIVLLIRMVTTKVLAMLLGPAGIGIQAIYESVISLARTAVDLGISSSGVRQIALAVGSEDRAVIATTIFTLRRICLVLGIVGAIALFLSREALSRLAFGNADHGFDIGLLSIILIFGAVMAGQGVLLQGMRRIGDLAKMNIFGALAGTVLSIPVVYVWGPAGIPIYMVLGAGIGELVAWSYARRVPIERFKVPLPQVAREATSLLKMGFVFLASGLMTTGALFLLRVFVARQEGVYGAGQFQAATGLAMIYVGFILQAMGTDFYPRLTAVAGNNQRCNQLVNEQAEISILLALPGVLATLALAPWVIQVFYSSRFDQAATILCWQVTGTFLQVNSWPMGFIIVAKGRAAAFFWTELASYSFYVVLAWVGLKLFGLPGTGMAYLGLYAFHWCIVYVIVRRISGFSLSPANVRLSLLGAITVPITLFFRLTLGDPWATIIGCTLTLATGICTMRTLIRLVGMGKINRYLQKIRIPVERISPLRIGKKRRRQVPRTETTVCTE